MSKSKYRTWLMGEAGGGGGPPRVSVHMHGWASVRVCALGWGGQQRGAAVHQRASRNGPPFERPAQSRAAVGGGRTGKLCPPCPRRQPRRAAGSARGRGARPCAAGAATDRMRVEGDGQRGGEGVRPVRLQASRGNPHNTTIASAHTHAHTHTHMHAHTNKPTLSTRTLHPWRTYAERTHTHSHMLRQVCTRH
jgi:hypothetical protein